jgi:hypothetical protein
MVSLHIVFRPRRQLSRRDHEREEPAQGHQRGPADVNGPHGARLASDHRLSDANEEARHPFWPAARG